MLALESRFTCGSNAHCLPTWPILSRIRPDRMVNSATKQGAQLGNMCIADTIRKMLRPMAADPGARAVVWRMSRPRTTAVSASSCFSSGLSVLRVKCGSNSAQTDAVITPNTQSIRKHGRLRRTYMRHQLRQKPLPHRRHRIISMPSLSAHTWRCAKAASQCATSRGQD